MEIGDTFLLRDPRIDEHLWIVISEPQQDSERVVIVSLTSHREDKDQSCVLDVGDHPWIRHKTCVSYRDTKCVAESQLDSLVQRSLLEPREAATDDLLAKLFDGAEQTDEMPNKCRKVLVDQGYIAA